MALRKRDVSIGFRATPEEKELIMKKMYQLGTDNFNAYAIKMLIDGYVIKHDFKELRLLNSELGKIGSNVNQIAKRANESRNVKEADIKDIMRMLHQIQILINDNIGRLIK